jgi:hypothetical protein
MCDYSLHTVASRPAKIGDELVTTQFWNTTTRGFSPVGEPKLAVCLLPGTEGAFESEVQRELTALLREGAGAHPSHGGSFPAGEPGQSAHAP